MISMDKITEIFCIADDFCKELENNSSLKFEITAKRLYAASQRVL